MVKKGHTETQNYAMLSLYNSKFLSGLGKYFEVQDSLENALFYFNMFVKPDSSQYYRGLVLTSDVYAAYGNFVKAQEYLQKAKDYGAENPLEPEPEDTTQKKKTPKYLDPSTDPKFVEEFELERKQLAIDVARGFYIESQGKYDEMIKKQASLTKRVFPLADTTGKKKTFKIKKREYKDRQVEYANLFVDKADFLRLRGNYAKAASMYRENERLFERWKISTRSFPHIRNIYGNAIMSDDDNLLEKPYKTYAKIRKLLDRSNQVSSYHRFYNEVIESEIQAYIEAEKNKKARSLFLKYKLDAMHKYGTNSVYYLHALMLENEYSNRKKRYKKAIKSETKLKEGIVEVLPNDHSENLHFNEHFYDFYRRNNKIEEARIERETNEWIAQINYGEDSPEYSRTVLDLANFDIDMQDQFARSKENYEKHFDQVIDRQLHPHNPAYSEYLIYYSKLKVYLDDYSGAYRLKGEALKIAEERFGPNSEQYGLAMIDLASLNIERGEFDQAEAQLEKATEIIKEESGKRSLSYYLAMMELAELYQMSGKYREADETMQKAYKYLKKSGEGTGASVNSSEELAAVYITQGRYKAAEDILQRSINLNEKKYGEDHFRLVRPLSLYSQLYLVTGDYIDAEKTVKRALEIAESNLSDTAVEFMDNLVQLAEIYVAMGNYEDAEDIFKQARKLIQKKFGYGNYREAAILQKLADVNFRSENANIEVINKLLEEAKDIVLTTWSSTHPEYASLLEYQGKVYMEYEQYGKADTNIIEARKIWYDTFGKNHIKSARNEKLKGDLEYHREDYKLAYENYKIASESYKSILDDNHPEYIESRSKMGRALYASGDLAGAMKIYDETTAKYLEYLEKYFPALSEKEKGSYWMSIKGDFEAYNSLALAFGKKKGKTRKALQNIYSFKLSTKAILQSSSAKLKNRILNSGDGDLIFRYGQFIEKKELLTRALSMSESQRADQGINMATLEGEINDLEKELSEESEDFAAAFESEQYSWKDVKKALKPNEYAIEFVRFRHFDKSFTDSVIYAALLLHRKSKAPELVLYENGNELDQRYFKYYTNTIKYKVKDKKSYGVFWKELDAKIPDSATVYISADGVFNQMNVETLVDSNGTYIIDKNNILYVSNTKDLVVKRSEDYVTNIDDENKTAFLIGNPEFKGSSENINSANKVSSIEPLPGAEREILDVTKLLASSNWKYKTLTQGGATETEVKNMTSPRVFHVATHGFFMAEDPDMQKKEDKGDIADNPLLRSGLLFTGAGELLANNNIYDFNKSDGILTAYEAMNLNLDNTELVVLSACETGRGEIKSGEGVYGLQRSFIVAGADVIIMTLFKVNDQVTQELMNDFYEHWLAGEGMREAFLAAKKRIKEKYKSPIFWGSFMMIGIDE
jgi:CHAT domain-containing protein